MFKTVTSVYNVSQPYLHQFFPQPLSYSSHCKACLLARIFPNRVCRNSIHHKGTCTFLQQTLYTFQEILKAIRCDQNCVVACHPHNKRSTHQNSKPQELSTLWESVSFHQIRCIPLLLGTYQVRDFHRICVTYNNVKSLNICTGFHFFS